jgi:hypothetical protein
MALSADRNTPRREGLDYVYPMAASVTIYAGALVMLNASGHARPGATATGQRAVGVAQERKANGSTAGAETIRVWPGVFRFDNSTAGDAIAQADVGADCFIVDDERVAKTNGSSTRSVAGKVVAVDAQGVWVKIGI